MPAEKPARSNTKPETTVNTAVPGPPGVLFDLLPSLPVMSSYTSDEDDKLPIGQRQRAADAHLNPNDPAKDAVAGTPAYGHFGHLPASGDAPKAGRDGSNDNPDEFSDLRKPEDAQDAPANLEDQRGHVTQNQDPAAVRGAQHADTDEQRAAWSDDDPRYAGGKSEATWQENNDKEHNNS
jgi:hypothetical protein